MAKGKSEIDELLLELGVEPEADDLFRTYVEEIANKQLRDYQEIIQFSSKAGESLYLHILTGIFVLQRLRRILCLDDIEVQLLFSAFSVRDLNKLREFQDVKRSFNYLANATNVSRVLVTLEMERFFPEWRDYLKDIELLIRAHSRHYHTYDETLDQKYEPYSNKNKVLNYLVPIIHAMDVIDLSKTLEERAKKRDFIIELNRIFDDKQYKFVYHKVTEQRGILTNLIHNTIVEYLEEKKDLLPLLFYPDGVAYLVERDRDIWITDDEITELGKSIISNIESKMSEEFRKLIQSRSADIKVDEKCIALGLPFETIWSEVRNKISDKKYAFDDMNNRRLGRLEEAHKKLAGTKPSKGVPDPVAQIALIDEILAEKTHSLPPDDDVVRH